jgi:hypothetical protein
VTTQGLEFSVPTIELYGGLNLDQPARSLLFMFHTTVDDCSWQGPPMSDFSPLYEADLVPAIVFGFDGSRHSPRTHLLKTFLRLKLIVPTLLV